VAALLPGREGDRTYQNVRHKLLDVAARTGMARVQLVDPELGILADTAPGIAIGTRAFELEADRTEIARVLRGEATDSVLFRGSDGQLYKRGYAPVADGEGTTVAVVAVQGAADAFVHLERFRRWLLVYGALGAVVVILLSGTVARRLTRPLRALAGAAERIGRGELDHPAPAVRSRDEVALLAETIEEMRRALAARDERMQMMLSGIAHEIRNPLGGMELYAGLLREELASDPERRGHVERIERELAHLKAVVAEFLEYARRPRPELADVDCRALLEDVHDVLAKDASDAQVTCELTNGTGATQKEVIARADATQLRRALLNLGQNAIQATPPGGRVSLSCEAAGARVRLRVADTGRGISDADRERIFAPFYTTKEKGTGLGLAFVREITRDLGGELALESSPGAGAAFTIDLQRSQS
jgi:signal transduction histidine kinase